LPGEDILHRYRGQRIHPSYALLQDTIDAVDQDQTLDTVEHRLGRDPLLTYRFLRYANSAALALPHAVGSVRDALIALGYRHLRTWLQEQAQNASQDPNLEPIRASMVLRARIMENLAQVGIQEDLRRDIFLCGIFSQIDALLDQPLASALNALPISGRIASALISQRGPYLAWLQTASALNSGSTHAIRQACKTHEIAPQEVNRALLRALAEPAPTPRNTASNTAP
jgi:c-di-GMP-related signal transduction protein